MADLIKGIDISVIQGSIDFAAVAASGIQFVICRCGVGNGGKDSMYDRNVANATAAGLKVGAYHFIYPLPPQTNQPLRDPVKQAQLHAGWAGSTSTVPVVCCDLEWPAPQDWAKWGCSAAQIVEWTVAYLEAYEAATGVRPVVYTYPYFAAAIKLPTDFGQKYLLWIASYQAGHPAVPAPWTDWVLWQDSGGTGPNAQHLPSGVPVDGDKAKDLSLWSVQAPAPDPTPAPPPDPTPAPDPAPAPVPDPTPVPVVAPPAPPPAVNIFDTIASFLSGLFKK
jgi:lysozyme